MGRVGQLLAAQLKGSEGLVCFDVLIGVAGTGEDRIATPPGLRSNAGATCIWAAVHVPQALGGAYCCPDASELLCPISCRAT